MQGMITDRGLAYVVVNWNLLIDQIRYLLTL